MFKLLKRFLRSSERPQEDWCSYFRDINGSIASIFLDLGLSKRVPDRERSELLSISLEMKEPRDDGLSSSTEFKTLCQIDDMLATLLNKELGAIYCGRITARGRREFFYYVGGTKDCAAVVKRVFDHFGGYKYDCTTRPDSKWNQYFKVLYPSDEERQTIENQKVLEILEKNGDLLTESRDVRHWIYFRSENDCEKFSQAALALEYRLEPRPTNASGEFPFGVCISRLQSVQSADIDEAVLELYRLAKDFGGEYDGWETEAIRKLN